MKRHYDLVVFDWEGTLAEDSLGSIVDVLAKEALRFHLGEFDKCQARRYIALGLVGAIKQIFPNLSMHQYESFLVAVQESLSIASTTICLVDGAKSAVQKIYDSGIKIAIATNKGHVSLQRALQYSGLDDLFKVTRSASQVPAKPCPQMLEEIISEVESVTTRTLMVGDSVTDIEMAVSIGVDSIGMDFYHEQRAELLSQGAVHVFNNYQQLLDYLNL